MIVNSNASKLDTDAACSLVAHSWLHRHVFYRFTRNGYREWFSIDLGEVVTETGFRVILEKWLQRRVVYRFRRNCFRDGFSIDLGEMVTEMGLPSI